MSTQDFLVRGLDPLELPHQAQLRVNSDLSALTEVLSWFDQFNVDLLPRPVWMQCQLALAEGFTNAVRHAHKGQPIDTPIDIEAKICSHSLELRIWDYGLPSNLNQILENLSLDMDQRAEGGRGLKLMKRMADVLTYTRFPDQRNCLLIVKKFD